MKTAIVTGGSSGIGLAAARQLAKAGYRVGLVGRRAEVLQTAVAEIVNGGGEAWGRSLDVRDNAAVQHFVEDAHQRLGSIDLLVNAAGVFNMKPFEQTDAQFWADTIDANLNGAYYFCHAVWPYIENGQIINISSVAGVQPYPGCAAYSASKYGLIGLSQVLALEGKPRDIRVHVLCPGNTDTPIWTGKAPADVQARMMRPDAVADTICWLALSPPEVSFDPVVIRPSRDPWQAP
jgi:3-oxoacyl-[acyl-carrier protein] reductase